MNGPHRHKSGGLIDRTQPVAFTFDGRAYQGFTGDTLASALLANGVSLMGRSFKQHRPRGVLSAGYEEPNALVGAGSEGRFEPNTRATDLFIYPGLTTISQNRIGPLAYDLGAVNQLISPFIPAGFYYKTFLGPPALWKFYEHFIRAMAGLGKPPRLPDPDLFERRASECDIAIVGSGPAGLTAALRAARAGARVTLIEWDERLGGSLLSDPATLDGKDGRAFVEACEKELSGLGVRILKRATAYGFYDHQSLHVAQKCVEPGQAPASGGVSQRLWRVYAKRIVIAAGEIERPLAFSHNDRPGVMLAGAAGAYLNRYGVAAGGRAIFATQSNSAYRSALALSQSGVSIDGLIDSRAEAEVDAGLVKQAREHFSVHFETRPVEALTTRLGVKGLVAHGPKGSMRLQGDLIGVNGGATPSVHLHMQAGGGLDWNAVAGGFTPGLARQDQISLGACAGLDDLNQILLHAWEATGRLAGALGFDGATGEPPQAEACAPNAARANFVPAPGVKPKQTFVDPQNDVTLFDVDLAWREGYRSVEHLKRYTTLGMATDQGKTSNLIGLSRLAQNADKTPPDIGLTTFRPPFLPTTFGLLIGEDKGFHCTALRRPPLYAVHAALDPPWQPVGYWRRPRAYCRQGESVVQAGVREARRVRTACGLTDVSTLGKFEICGPDAAAFLEILCATSVGKLKVGRGRYTFMMREDGLVNDDGTVWRLEEDRYLLTSSTGGADRMAHLISYIRNILRPDLKVAIANQQEHYAALAVAGPKAKAALSRVLDFAEPPPHMGLATGTIAGTRALVLAASYSGERAFEIYVTSSEARTVWSAALAAVEAEGGVPYGLEALEILRIEKGHVETGGEIDGRTSAHDLRLEKMLNPRGGYIGEAGMNRPFFQDPQRLQLVGLESLEGAIPEGSMLVEKAGDAAQGHVTGSGLRTLQSGFIALGLLQGGRSREGETLTCWSGVRKQAVRARIVAPHFYDPQGALYRD